MGMEVLLRRSIEGVGRVGEVVRVKNGYARNFLLPKGMAALVSPESQRQIAKDKELEAIREADLAQQRKLLAEKLADVQLTVEARAGEDGHLYGSVGPRQVVAAFQDLGHEFEERQIRFETVRELGEYDVDIALASDHIVPVKLWVVQDARDAAIMAEEAAAREAAAAEADAQAEAPAEGAEPSGDVAPSAE